MTEWISRRMNWSRPEMKTGSWLFTRHCSFLCRGRGAAGNASWDHAYLLKLLGI